MRKPSWPATMCGRTQRPYIWKQAIQSTVMQSPCREGAVHIWRSIWRRPCQKWLSTGRPSANRGRRRRLRTGGTQSSTLCPGRQSVVRSTTLIAVRLTDRRVPRQFGAAVSDVQNVDPSWHGFSPRNAAPFGAVNALRGARRRFAVALAAGRQRMGC